MDDFLEQAPLDNSIQELKKQPVTKFQYLWNRDIENFCMYIMERSGASVM